MLDASIGVVFRPKVLAADLGGTRRAEARILRVPDADMIGWAPPAAR
jgi:hypothetical protein